MDVEKRMNLSLDAIIKQKSSKRPTKGKIAAGKGRGKVKIANVTSQRKGDAQTKRRAGSIKAGQGLSIQKKGMKIQKGSSQAIASRAVLRGSKKGSRAAGQGAVPRKGSNPKRLERTLSVPKKSSKANGKSNAKRTVDLPRLTDLRITISNERAAAAAYPMTGIGAPGYQSQIYPQPMWAAHAQIVQQPTYGFGPRNMQPREARAAPDYPVPRAQIDYGVSRRTLAAGQPPSRRAYKDFDDPNQNKSYMRMDTR